MTNLWLLYLGFPLLVLGVRFAIIYNSLARARRAGQASTPSLQIPWREGILFTVIGVIGLAVGLIYSWLLKHPEMWTIGNAGGLVAVLGIGQLIQACAQRLPEPKRLKSECLVRISAVVVAVIGAVCIIVYVISSWGMFGISQ